MLGETRVHSRAARVQELSRTHGASIAIAGMRGDKRG